MDKFNDLDSPTHTAVNGPFYYFLRIMDPRSPSPNWMDMSIRWLRTIKWIPTDNWSDVARDDGDLVTGDVRNVVSMTLHPDRTSYLSHELFITYSHPQRVKLPRVNWTSNMFHYFTYLCKTKTEHFKPAEDNRTAGLLMMLTWCKVRNGNENVEIMRNNWL